MLLNEITKQWIDAYCQDPSTTLLLESGGDVLSAEYIIEYINKNVIADSNHSPILYLTKQDKRSIGIEQVRDLQKQLSLTANYGEKPTRFAVISQASLLTVEAQNSLLKLLEELPRRTLVCLVVNDKQDVLPTIQSRCFAVRILPISERHALKYAKSYDIHHEKALSYYRLSDGRADIFSQLLSGDDQYLEVVASAKAFLAASVFDRQKLVKDITTPVKAMSLLDGLHIVVKAAMRTAKQDDSKLKWRAKLIVILKAKRELSANASVKLIMLYVSVTV